MRLVNEKAEAEEVTVAETGVGITGVGLLTSAPNPIESGSLGFMFANKFEDAGEAEEVSEVLVTVLVVGANDAILKNPEGFADSFGIAGVGLTIPSLTGSFEEST